MLIFLLKNRSNKVFSTFPENPDLADVQIAIKHPKIDENSKKFRKLILELSNGGGFIKIHQHTGFLHQFEIYGFSRFS